MVEVTKDDRIIDLEQGPSSESDVDLLIPNEQLKIRSICQNRCVQVSLIVLHIIFCLVNIVTLGFASTFDTLCAVEKAKSIVNCTEKVIIQRPQPVVIVFFATTIANAVVVLVTLRLKPAGVKFSGYKNALKQLIKKGSFWSFNITYVLILAEYIILLSENLDIVNTILGTLLIMFFGSKLIIAYVLNYVYPVKFPKLKDRSLTRVYIWIAYWITLVLFFLATAHSSLAIALDVAEKISPLGKVSIGSRDFGTVTHLVFLGVKATFEVRLFVFYWNKFFHGNKDLFSMFIVLKQIEEEENPETGGTIDVCVQVKEADLASSTGISTGSPTGRSPPEGYD